MGIRHARNGGVMTYDHDRLSRNNVELCFGARVPGEPLIIALNDLIF